MRTQNLAIVFTDIKGFTERTSRQTYEENQRMLRVHDALLTPVFKAFGGRPVKTIGDAFLVVFESPTQAVLCGVGIQDRLWDYNRRVPEPEQIHVRVAVNMGEVRLEKSDVFGEPVNIAARVEGLADAGEVLFTEAVYLAMNKAEVPSEEHGVHELKGIPEKVKVYRVPAGVYRLETGGSAPLPSGGPPFGGLALSRVPSLADADPAKLGGSSELSAMFSGALSGLSTAASGLATKARSSFSVEGLSPGPVKGIAALVALALLIAVGSMLFRSPVEKALSSGDFKAARAAAKAMKDGPEKTYYLGRIAEEQKAFADAAEYYVEAAQGGERAGFKRLKRMTESDTCAAREYGAKGLGNLGDSDGLSALKSLESGSFKDEGGDDALTSLFGCSSRAAAKNAIRRIEAASK